MDSRLWFILLLIPLSLPAETFDWRFSLDPRNLISESPTRYGVDIELQGDQEGASRVNAFPRLQLTPQSSVSLSIKNYRPNLNVEGRRYKSSLRLRGDGVKVRIRPVDPQNQLEIDIKVTDDESSLGLRYKF
ncbi:hypothetical protein [Zobellella maritima]|uniref:hypothetical protein n=1 Tax=Zobellella maritima TaxID=2059725 RepID=UPI000E302DE1|nr:hypothetical protein [Zobellella maritima]